MKWLIYSLLTLFIVVFSSAFTVVDNPTVPLDDLGERRSVDTLSLAYRHSEAQKSMVIWGDTMRAERLWRDIIAEDSLYAPALYSLSRLDRAPLGESLELAARAFKVDSSNKWYAQHYGVLLLGARQYDRALDVYKRLMTIDKHDVSTYFYLASLYRMRGMPYSAISVLDSAEIRLGRHPYLADIKRDMLIETMQYDRAIAEGERLLLDSPHDVETHLGLARTYESAKRDSMASRYYDSALQLDSTSVEVVAEVLDYYLRKNNYLKVFELGELFVQNDAIDEHERIDFVRSFTKDLELYSYYVLQIGKLIQHLEVLYPTNRDVVEMQTMHLFLLNQHVDAITYLREHLNDENVTPRDFYLAVDLAEYLGLTGFMSEDIAHALRLFPDNIEIISLSAFHQYSMGNKKQAIKIYRKALKRVEEDEMRSRLWGSIGDIYHELNNNKEAFKAYRKALEYDAENALVLNNYAYFMALENIDLERALAMAQMAITIEEGNYNYLDTYAWILHLLGRNTEAKRYMVQALSLNGQQSSSLLAHYADILWDLGEEFMAHTYWKRAVDRGYDAEEMQQHIAEKVSNKR